MATEERVTYCRICEPLCGMVATVTDGEVTKLRPDGEHPLSKGFACPKGIAMTEIQNDPDRVTHPLQRTADGGFERISWEQALDEIGERLGAIKDAHGGELDRLVHGQPRRLQLLAPALGQGLPRRARLPALLHGLLPGRRQPLRRLLAALRLAVRAADPRPRALRVPVHGRRQPARLARQRDERAAGQGPAARDHRPRRPGDRRRPAADRDRAAVRARRGQSRLRRLAAALDPAGDLRRVPAGSRGARRRGARGRGACGALAADFPPEETEAQTGVEPPSESATLARDLAAAERLRDLRPHRLLPGAQRHAGQLPARRAGAASPATSIARAARCSATRRSPSTGSPS